MRNRFFDSFDLPDDQDEAAWGVIRRFWWYPSVVEESSFVVLLAGDQEVARFDSMEELRAFVSGMATAELALPEEVIAELARVTGVDADRDDSPDWWAGRDLP